MQYASKQVPHDHSRVQRAIVLLILEHPDGLARAELRVELEDIDQGTFDVAMSSLRGEGVLTVGEERVRASRCARHLDALALIAG